MTMMVIMIYEFSYVIIGKLHMWMLYQLTINLSIHQQQQRQQITPNLRSKSNLWPGRTTVASPSRRSVTVQCPVSGDLWTTASSFRLLWPKKPQAQVLLLFASPCRLMILLETYSVHRSKASGISLVNTGQCNSYESWSVAPLFASSSLMINNVTMTTAIQKS